MPIKPQSRVLIVDDMRVNRLILSSLLASNGVQSDLAESGKECLALCRKTAYDLILLDHRMPEDDGVDTLVQLKEIFRQSGREVPVVCHTTEDARKNINLYKAAGFADVLIKPIQPQELSNILMTYLPEGSAPDEAKAESSRAHAREEIARLPDWARTIPGVDLTLGIENCETAEDYLDALAVFAASITEKANEIERYLSDKNYNMYTIKVHSLKSMARLIGAAQLSKLAADLEYAGKHDDIAAIEEGTPRLLEEYRAYTGYLAHAND